MSVAGPGLLVHMVQQTHRRSAAEPIDAIFCWRSPPVLIIICNMTTTLELNNHDVHIPFPRPVSLLKPGARRLAKKSANRLSDPVVARQVEKLAVLIQTERDGKLKQGDLLMILIDQHRLRPVDLARELSCRANHLSEMYWVAKTFPLELRKPHVPWTHYWMACRTVRKFRKLKLSPMTVLGEIARHGFTQHRDVTRHFAARLRRVENARAIAQSVTENGQKGINRCYHAQFQTLGNVFEPASIKLIWADPPYSNYTRVGDGRYSGGSVTRTGCDNETAAEAIAVTVDLLRDWGPKLRRGGVLLLWQAAGPLRRLIADAIDKFGWELEATVIWDKGNVTPGNFERPYSTQTEWCWVLKRQGDRLVNHDNSSRGDVIRFNPSFRAAGPTGYDHCFEKPDALCRFLVGKHTFGGDLCFEPFGCTGSLCVAAASMGRNWVYSESHAGNFAIGSSRLSTYIRRAARSAG
jgi:DNA modification methylase